MAIYPGAIKTFVSKVDNVDEVVADDVNLAYAEITAVETELGADVAGTATNLVTRLAKLLDGGGYLKFADSAALTISSGGITATQNFHTVDTESSAASDNLDTVTSSTDGYLVVIRPASDARTIVIRHGVGNILCNGGQDITLDDYYFAILIYDANLSKWLATTGQQANVTQKSNALLSTTANVDMNSTAKQTLYTVPGGYSCIIDHVVVRNADTDLTTAQYGFGFDTDASDVIASTDHLELTGATLYTVIHAKIGAKLGASSDDFGIRCATAQGVAATTTIDTFGYLVV
jgi:hypothetical protein